MKMPASSMTPEDWKRVKSVAADAWSRPPAERAALAVSLCAGDAALYHEVVALLDAMDRVGDRFDTPALAIPGARAAVDDAIDGRRPALVGDHVGPWRLVRELGRGGMAVVYLAERTDAEFHQRAAVKIVRAAIDDDRLLRRFREERRILATLDHPHIARFIDGGATEIGLPYVVMEYVEGLRIDEFCDSRRLDVRQRVALFRQVCVAVHYAHQRLIVHRDIKASNILITAGGTPKLLDFGIAKILESRDESEPTRTLFRMVTPESASPEQLRGEPMTTASDTYALGVLLYRLLTGRSPYRLSTGTETELIRAVCEQVPDAPSLAARAASGRAADAPRRAVDVDLDPIVLMALRKEPERRYASVDQMSADLLRYLDGQPVQAAPDSRAYRARKFVARHRAAVAAAAALALAVAAGVAATAWQARVARRERARAEQRFNDVRRLANSFLFEFHDAIVDLPGSLKARALVVKRSAEYLDNLAREAQDDVALQRELATANERLAVILSGGGTSNLGDFGGAQARYGAALSMREALAARADAEPADIDALAQLHVQLARFFTLRGNLERAEDDATRAVTLLQSRPADGTTANLLGRQGTAYHQLGFVQARRGKDAAALESLERAGALARRQVASRPDDQDERTRLAHIQTDYAGQLITARRVMEAVTEIHEAREWFQKLVATDPVNVRYQHQLIALFNTEGRALNATADHAGAVRAHQAAAAIGETLLAADPEDKSNLLSLVYSHAELGASLLAAGDAAGGMKRLRQAIAEAEAIIKSAPENGFVLSQLASTRLELGRALLKQDPVSAAGCREIEAGMKAWEMLAARAEVPGEAAADSATYERLRSDCVNHKGGHYD